MPAGAEDVAEARERGHGQRAITAPGADRPLVAGDRAALRTGEPVLAIFCQLWLDFWDFQHLMHERFGVFAPQANAGPLTDCRLAIKSLVEGQRRVRRIPIRRDLEIRNFGFELPQFTGFPFVPKTGIA